MAHEIKVPSFGESIAESTVAQWLKSDGERVEKGQPIVTLDTEKASSDLEADVSGRLKIRVAAGTDVAIGAVIGEIEEEPGQAAEKGESRAQTPSEEHPVEPSRQSAEVQEQEGPLHMAGPSKEKAEERGVGHVQELETLETIPGAGREDMTAGQETAASQTPPAPQPAAPQPSVVQAPEPRVPQPPSSPEVPQARMQPEPPPRVQPARGETREPMSRLRRTIAQQMLRARNETAMLTTFAEADMSGVLSLRERHQEEFQKRHGVKLGFMSFFVKACVEALRAFPTVNASIDGDDIVYHHYYNIGVAVSTERGLVVPVISSAERKSFAEIEKELADLAQRARAGKVSLEELKYGTFTITNGGVFGSMLSTPLLNPPQAAILGMHAITERPVVVEGKIEIRPMMYLALSYDHRLIDGKEAVQFLVHVKEHITAPERMLLGI